jgi:transcriptional regulator with XRE-family HTH domain
MADGESAARLGEIIRRQRELSELSMRQFADLAGISNPYLSQIERGLRAPSERVLDSIAAALQVSADKLYEQAGVRPGEEPETPPVVEAIRNDPQLTGRQRQALLEVYRSFTAASRVARRRRPAEPAAGDPAAPAASVADDDVVVPEPGADAS